MMEATISSSVCDPQPAQELATADESASPPTLSVDEQPRPMPALGEVPVSKLAEASIQTVESTSNMSLEHTLHTTAVVPPTQEKSASTKLSVAAKVEFTLTPIPIREPNITFADSKRTLEPIVNKVDSMELHTTMPGPSLTVGKAIEELTQKDPGGFHAIPPGCPTISDEFDPKELLGGFERFVWGPPLPRDAEERAQESNWRLKQYVGDMTDAQFNKLAGYCSEENLRMPYDIKVKEKSFHTKLEKHFTHRNILDIPDYVNLTMTRRIKKRIESDPRYSYVRVLKYRGDRTSLQKNRERDIPGPLDLEPGKELLFHVRIYRPFVTMHPDGHHKSKEHKTQGAPLFQQNHTFLGRQPLEELLDRITCINDFGPRTDCSECPDVDVIHNVKEAFPSGFLFINGVFYVDRRHPRCVDYSEPVREWARRHRVADYPCRSLAGVRFDSLRIRMGYPELYMHQGNCEHLFTFSDVSVLHPSDYCSTSVYPYRTALLTTNAIYCTICTHYVAKWIVTGCERIPFDPAYICDTCHKQYNYVDGTKVGEFQAYRCYDKQVQL